MDVDNTSHNNQAPQVHHPHRMEVLRMWTTLHTTTNHPQVQHRHQRPEYQHQGLHQDACHRRGDVQTSLPRTRITMVTHRNHRQHRP